MRNVGGCCHIDALLTFTSSSVVASKRDKSRLVTLPALGVVAMSAAGTLPAPQTRRTRSAIYRLAASSRLHTRASRLRCIAAATDAAAEKKKARQRSSGCEEAQHLFPLVHQTMSPDAAPATLSLPFTYAASGVIPLCQDRGPGRHEAGVAAQCRRLQDRRCAHHGRPRHGQVSGGAYTSVTLPTACVCAPQRAVAPCSANCARRGFSGTLTTLFHASGSRAGGPVA